jgi:hypothetical protein
MEKKDLEIYVIAYNNLFCVDYQIKTFKAFCQDDHKLVIIDSNCGDHLENTSEKKRLSRGRFKIFRFLGNFSSKAKICF